MPVEETLDADLDADTSNLDELDRKAKKATKALEKQRKALEKAQQQREKGGGIFQGPNIPKGGGAPRDIAPLSKQDKAFEKKLARAEAKIAKAEFKQFGKNKGLLKGLTAGKIGKNLFNFGKNPAGAMIGILKKVPILGQVLQATAIALFIVNEIVKLDAFLKKFFDIADNRISLFRSRQEQANIGAGLAQKIITTASGGTEVRDSYNTFEIFETSQQALQADYALQNMSSVP
ncbi:hypothetical protein LCGC14_0380250 [marine sediment metagenome]|uniref:Uncharacterized protein n=1 Tax=marine sediment metagenome TaxID=412755 RepID=A0A0F9T8A7_9ZZZZ